jgi:hypothetical protein
MLPAAVKHRRRHAVPDEPTEYSDRFLTFLSRRRISPVAIVFYDVEGLDAKDCVEGWRVTSDPGSRHCVSPR